MDYFDSTTTPEEQTAEFQAGETFGSVPAMPLPGRPQKAQARM